MFTSQLALLFSVIALVTSSDFDTVFKWKYMDYDWDTEDGRQEAIFFNEYNHTQLVPMDVDVSSDGRIFITVIGHNGVAVSATLATVTNKIGASGPLLRPYPDWSYFKKGDCNSIQEVYRIAIDECQRLWVLDSGYERVDRICPPELLAFDLRTDRLIQRIILPEEISVGRDNKSLLVDPIVETYGYQCEDTTVYMSDTWGYGLIIWNNGDLYRLENPVFEPSKGAGNISTGKYTEYWPDSGIVTMALSPSNFPDEERFLFFHSLASFDLYAVPTEVLKRSIIGSEIKFLQAKNILSSHSLGIAFSSQGTLFMSLTKDSEISCWNKNELLIPLNIKIVAQDTDRLEYVNGMKVIRSPYSGDEELWVLSNRYLTFLNNDMNFNDHNFYVLKTSVNILIYGTDCEEIEEEDDEYY